MGYSMRVQQKKVLARRLQRDWCAKHLTPNKGRFYPGPSWPCGRRWGLASASLKSNRNHTEKKAMTDPTKILGLAPDASETALIITRASCSLCG